MNSLSKINIIAYRFNCIDHNLNDIRKLVIC